MDSHVDPSHFSDSSVDWVFSWKQLVCWSLQAEAEVGSKLQIFNIPAGFFFKQLQICFTLCQGTQSPSSSFHISKHHQFLLFMRPNTGRAFPFQTSVSERKTFLQWQRLSHSSRWWSFSWNNLNAERKELPCVSVNCWCILHQLQNSFYPSCYSCLRVFSSLDTW